MTALGPWELVAALSTAVVSAALVAALVPPTRKLAGRVRPYTAAARTGLGLAPDVDGTGAGSKLGAFRPLVDAAARRLSGVVDRRGEGELALRLRRAGWFEGVDDARRIAEYRSRQLGSTAAGLSAGTAVGIALGMGAARVVVVAVLGMVVGATRTRGRLERAIERRRAAMRLELYTVDQVLAVHVRSGSGVVQAVQGVVASARGEVAGELAEALRLHRSGMPAAAAFRRIADITPEPACARTYALLASADERGFDLAGGLLSMARDLREGRREEMRRVATRRRAAMLVPTIAVLAPVMLLFVAAPLPSLILSWR